MRIKSIMLRIIAVSYLLVNSVASITDGDEILNSVYNNISSATTTSKCDNIVGDGTGCYECYHCKEGAVERLVMNNRDKTEFQLFDSTCSSATPICCFTQTQNRFRSNMNCGQNNPEGHPRRVRNSIRSVLPGEYPWRAWIYSNKNGNVPLCAAVYFSSDYRAVLTTASCVYGYLGDDLLVSFTKDIEDSYKVNIVIRHKYYLRETRFYDIAIVSLVFEKSLPRWVKPVCLPEEAVNYATPCITVSSDDNYSNVIIPQQSNCAVDGVPLDPSFLCTVSPINDYDPETGGGLMCPEVLAKNLHYTIYGITLYKSGNSSIAVHTNITFFKDWIIKSLNDLQ